MLSPKPSTVSTRPRLSTAADHGETSRLSSSPPLNGSIGSTTEGSWSPLATYPRQRPSNATTPCWNKRPWRHNLNQIASGKPGAVHPPVAISNQSQRQLAPRPGVGINKVSDMLRYGLTRNVAPGLNFLSDIFGNVVCPMLQSIEGYDANRIIELPRHKVADDGFEIRSLDLSLAVDATAAKAIN